MIPPLWMSVSVKEGPGGGRPFRLWLPLFLLWPLLILFFPLVLLMMLMIVVVFGGRSLEAIREVYFLLCALRGLRVDVDGPSDRVRVRVY